MRPSSLVLLENNRLYGENRVLRARLGQQDELDEAAFCIRLVETTA
jgi:hypothetical protein